MLNVSERVALSIPSDTVFGRDEFLEAPPAGTPDDPWAGDEEGRRAFA